MWGLPWTAALEKARLTQGLPPAVGWQVVRAVGRARQRSGKRDLDETPSGELVVSWQTGSYAAPEVSCTRWDSSLSQAALTTAGLCGTLSKGPGIGMDRENWCRIGPSRFCAPGGPMVYYSMTCLRSLASQADGDLPT